jgi:hypothetical protein
MNRTRKLDQTINQVQTVKVRLLDREKRKNRKRSLISGEIERRTMQTIPKETMIQNLFMKMKMEKKLKK